MDPKDPRHLPQPQLPTSPTAFQAGRPRDSSPERATAIDLEGFHSAPSNDRACLVVIYGPELGKRASLGSTVFEIGRSSRADLAIDQESISRHHARISWDGKSHVIYDLGSTNGTFVNDQSCKERALKDGDQVKLGRSILKYMAGDNIEANYHEEIYRLMTMDALTQTHNRRYFNEALEREYNRSLRYRRALSLILFDIDHFKKINDTYGHVAGDSVLRQLALVVKPRLRTQDVLARVGGEEFAVLLPEVDLVGARIAADKVRSLVEAARFLVDHKEFGCTVSVGVTTFGDNVTSAGMLYELADQNLYAAKNGGRNRVAG
ncbi:FHA domain/GGDEF domain protein [Labilithrix luteola]|uniref:diguanylate cyclase n=1 Tax=Labilithrix luteola TaxID=1391654 RepID=A0A0K1Q1X9_9BACT|nr:GGDEF domain-containing protein [Labilithrix luteola]AKU99379.1 FHA domain/GGDEF domain protein [Labilithrix luteola]